MEEGELGRRLDAEMRLDLILLLLGAPHLLPSTPPIPQRGHIIDFSHFICTCMKKKVPG